MRRSSRWSTTTCPSRIRCQAATGSWTKSRQWEIQRTLFSLGTGHRVAAYPVVGGLEVGKCPFKITGIPEQYMVETFSPRRADQALHE